MVALGCFSPALGSQPSFLFSSQINAHCAIADLFAGWVSSEHSRWPPTFNAVVLTFSIALALVGVALNWSDNLRYRVSLFEAQLSAEEAAEQKAGIARPTDPEKDNV